MKRILIFIQLLCVAGCLFAGPKNDAVYHLISKSYTLNEDGSMDYHFRKEIQLLTRTAFDTYGETFITYNTELQTLTINEAYTIRKDGSIVQTPSNAFNPSLPYGCTDCERLNVIREMVVTHTALEYDATIVLDYTIHSTRPFLLDLMERINLYENEPVEKYEVSVNFPYFLTMNSMVNYHDKNMIQSKTENADSTVTMTWSFSDLPKKPVDAYLPADYLPYILLTTAPSPSYFMEEFISQNAFMPAPVGLFDDVLSTILKDKSSEVEKMLAIRDYVADNVHTNYLPIGYMNFIVASPYTIWKTNCATPFEKNLLFKAMLEAAHIDATFGVFYNQLMTDPESALRVAAGGQIYYVSAANKHAVSLDKTKTPDSFIDLNGIATNFEAAPMQLDVSAHFQIDAQGEIRKDGGTQRITSPKTEKMVTQGYNVAKGSIRLLSGDYYELTLNDGQAGCTMLAANIARDRIVPVAVTQTSETYQYEIELPQKMTCISNPYVVEKNFDFGSAQIQMQLENGKIKVSRTLVLKESFITDKKQIRQLRELLAEWNAPRPILLKTNR